jgi:N-succinyldiaminopimelate aminotransferase
MPNPFYQIYEGAALLAGAEPYYLDTTPANDFVPDFDHVPDTVWRRCQLVYICSPGNPTGKILDLDVLKRLLDLSDQYSFVIAADECYSEIYPDESAPPLGLLEAAARLGRTDFRRCVVFHSLSKRSNLPGLRSGFVAGDADILKTFLRYRTYHGCALPLPAQYASIAAWNDETHVRANRDAYRAKFQGVLEILRPVLDVTPPEASFYLWPRLPINDEIFTKRLYTQENVSVLPGSYLSRDNRGYNPGLNHIRIALVPTFDQCIIAAWRMRALLERMR